MWECSTTAACGFCLLDSETIFVLRGLCEEVTMVEQYFDVFYIQNGLLNNEYTNSTI